MIAHQSVEDGLSADVSMTENDVHAHAENRDGILWKNAGVSSVVIDHVGKHDGRIAES